MTSMLDEENDAYYRSRGLEIMNPIANGLTMISFFNVIHSHHNNLRLFSLTNFT